MMFRDANLQVNEKSSFYEAELGSNILIFKIYINSPSRY